MFETIVITMPMTTCVILSALLGLSLRHRWNCPRSVLLLFLIVAALLYWCHGVFFYHQLSLLPFSDTLYSFCNPAVFPLFLVYIEKLTLRRPSPVRQMAYLLPSLVCCLAVGVLYSLMDHSETLRFIERHLYHNEYASLSGLAWWQAIAHLMVKLVFALQIPPVLVFGWRYVRLYNQTVENYYSNTEGKLLSSINTLLVLFVVAAFVSFTFNIIGRYQFAHSLWLLLVPSAFYTVLFVLIGHVGLHQHFSMQTIVVADESEPADQPDAPSQPAISHDTLSDAIQRLIDDEKLFLKPNLKTEDLAHRLNTNKNYIYQAINIKMGQSFTTYVNQKRIEHAVRLIEQNPKALLTEISVQSGFTSTSAFYRNFKLFKGCSPKDFQQQFQST